MIHRLIALCLVASALAFTPSTFTGRSVTCRPTAFSRTALSMNFLNRFGFGNKKEDVAVLDKEDAPVTLDTATADEVEEEKKTETQQLLEQVKEAGLAGVISYALWELGFWTISVPVCVFGYREVTGHWPDFSNPEDLEKLGAEAFAFVNFARFAVPLRIGLALSTTPWIDEKIVAPFLKKDETPVREPDDLEEVSTNGE